MSFRLLVATIVLGLLSGPSTAAASDWRLVRSPHFTLIGNAGDGAIKRVALELEQFRQGLASIVPQARVESTVPTTVYVFKDKNAFRPYLPLRNGKPKEDVAGYFSMHPEGNYVALTADRPGGDGHQVIFHEYVHFLTRSQTLGLPLWLNEGIAEFYSTFDMLDGGRKMRIGKPITWHVVLLRRGALIPLKALLVADQSSPFYDGGLQTGRFYAQSWLLTHFLMFGSDGKYRAGIGQYVGLVSKGTAPEAAFEKAFGLPLDRAEKEIHAHLNKTLLPIMDYAVKGEPPTEAGMTVEPIAESAAAVMLADLQVRIGRGNEAEPLLAKAVASGEGSARAHATLGEIRLRDWRIDEALPSLQSAAKAEPANPAHHLHLGEAYFRLGSYAEAAAAYGEAARLRTELGEAHLGHGLSLVGMGKTAEAAASIERAERAGLGGPNVYRERAYLHLGIGKHAEAADDANAYIEAAKWGDESSLYLGLVAHFGHRGAGNDKEARSILDAMAPNAKGPSGEWVLEIIKYLRGDSSESAFMSKANNVDKQTEAHAYIGLDQLAKGDKASAITHLKWVVDKGNRRFVEYGIARGVLRRLGA